ncbi:gamma-glutamyltransferase [Leptodesmis sichuanensis]|uniref:gamma-glutamyltransferase n=1 Tax=Leptodesmis sichuanensis TaxID=2906798 RepID=UPI001F1FF338|nr:gamma-glutamyltransferase [Leptodesmis sichuanensis]UIE39960.1 gamma-glutamyltransferase [Leptodesmis sichuanensis A121]
MKFLVRLGCFSVTLVCSTVLLPFPSPAQDSPALNQGKQGMVVSAHPLASAAGLQMLKAGGNAVDAAVATTFAISVTEPYSAGIGGGGFLLLRSGQTGAIKALDFRERAPLAATRNMYLDAQGKVRPNLSTDGYLAVGVPGTVAGLYEVHRQYGKLPWKTLVQPAIALADQGFLVSPRMAAAIVRQQTLQQNPAARKIFTRNGNPLQVGETLIQQDLAKTLQAIAQNPQSFYQGWIAQAIAQDMQANGGLITLQDLQRYRPIWREAVCGMFRMARVCSMPPPSSGGVHLLQMLNMIGDTDLKGWGWHSPDALHLLIETMRIAYADRARYLGDPDFVKVPVAALISPAYGQQRRQEINLRQARPSSQVQAADPALIQRLNHSKESGDTSHLSVVDKLGNAVSLTFTVNLSFGAGIVTPGTGIVLNNEMDDFAAAPDVPNAFGLVGGDANAIAPGKTPLSSMTPTIVTEQGQLRLVTGSPGGSTIITTVLQIVLNVLVYGMDGQRAVASPRLHHQWLPDQVMVETFGFDPLTLAELQRRGQRIQERSGWGNANAIVRTPEGILKGAADPRGEGVAYGF